MRLPTLDADSLVPAQPSKQEVRYPSHIASPGAVGEAVERAGAQLEKQVAAQDQAADQDELATARSVFLTKKAQIEASLQDTPDWKTAPDTYTQGMGEAGSAAAEGITNPKVRAKFNDSVKLDTAQGLAPVLHMVNTRQKDVDRGDLDTLADNNMQTALASPQNAPGLIASTEQAFDAAAAKGTISAEEHAVLRRSWPETYGKGWAAKQKPEDLVRVLTTPGGAAQPGETSKPSLDTLKAAFVGQESGGDPNVPDSPTGAMGVGQIEPGTWKQFAKPGEDPHNAKDNAAVSGRYVDHLAALPNVQGDPDRIAVGYYSGEGNIAPRGSATPYLKDKTPPKGVKGPSTSQYVAQIRDRMGGGTGAVSLDREQAPVAQTGTPADFIPLPERAVMLREALASVRADQAGAHAAFADQARDTIDFLHSGGDATQSHITPEQVRTRIPDEEGIQLADNLQHAYDYADAAKQIATAPESKLQGIVTGKMPQGPEGFRASAAEAGALLKAVTDRQQAIYGDGKNPGDPASYVTRNFPDVGKAYADATTGPGANDPAKFAVFISKSRGAQTALGIPPEYQRVLPVADAEAHVHRLMSEDPKAVLPDLAAVEKRAGSAWPLVYRDLARAGLPGSFQALLVVQPQDAQTMAAALGREADAKGKGSTMADAMRGVKYNQGDNKAPKSVTDLVEQQLAQNADLQSLRASHGAFGRAGAASFSSVYDAVRTTAFYLFQTRGLSPQAAADQAAGMVTGPFDFAQQPDQLPVRLPKGSSDNFHRATQATIDGLQAKDLRPLPARQDAEGHELAERPESERADEALTHAKNAYWIAVNGADGRGAVQAIDPQSRTPIMRANGRPLEIPFSQMASIATGAAKKRAASQANNAALMEQEAFNK